MARKRKAKRSKKNKIPLTIWLIPIILFALIYVRHKDEILKIFGKRGKTKPIKKSSRQTTKKRKILKRKTNNKIYARIYYGVYDERSDKIRFRYRVVKVDKDSLAFDIIRQLGKIKSRGNIIGCATDLALIDYEQKNGYIYLNFDESLLKLKSRSYEEAKVRIYQIVKSILSAGKYKGIVFLINGKRKKYIGGEGFILDRVFSNSISFDNL